MRSLLYHLLKGTVRAGFYFYFQEIRMVGIENVPSDRPVMLLPNHQNALIDPLLYAVFAKNSKPYFLTRSDVFNPPLLKWVFEGLRMIPVYRLRDGRDTLQRNQEVFDLCSTLFARGEQVLLFPEASHNLKRQVRPLSKGFTRILAYSFQEHPGLDIQIVPVGVNYQNAAGFPDRAAFYFGEAFSAAAYWSEADGQIDVAPLRERVFQAITTLTTHIPADRDYDACIRELERSGTDLTDPSATRSVLATDRTYQWANPGGAGISGRAWDALFRLLNAPVLLPWRWIEDNLVSEPEFTSTFRFPYSLLAFPLYYLVLGWALAFLMPPEWALSVVVILWLHNLAYVKWRGRKRHRLPGGESMRTEVRYPRNPDR